MADMARKKLLAKIDKKSELVGLGRITNKGEWIGRNSRFKEGLILNGNESETEKVQREEKERWI